MSVLKLAQLQKIEVKLKRHKLIWNTVQDFASSGVIREASGPIWVQNLKVRQHAL